MERITICKHSGLAFLARNGHVKTHPYIRAALSLANREGWYRSAKFAIQAERRRGTKELHGFKVALYRARRNWYLADVARAAREPW